MIYMTEMIKQLVQQLSVTVGTKGSILYYVLVEFFNIDIIKFCWRTIFIQFYNPGIMSYTCNKCGKVVSYKWAHNIEHAFKEWDEEEQVLFSKL